MSGRRAEWLSQAEIEQRLQNFETRTLHAFTEANPLVLLVAVRDPAKRRDKLTADLALSGTGPAQVTEGRLVTYELKLTNKGPDTATGITLSATPGFSLVSVKPSQGKCNMSGQNVYCKFSSLEKDQTMDVKIVERCKWYQRSPNEPPQSENRAWLMSRMVEVGATEQDPSIENNEVDLTTQVFEDPNKGPIIEVLSPHGSRAFKVPQRRCRFASRPQILTAS